MKNIIVGLMVVIISGCGWSIRGSSNSDDKLAMTSPLDLVIVTKDDHSPFINALRQTLPNYKISEIKASGANSLKLIVDTETLDRRTAGVGSNALTSAYELTLRVDYSIVDVNGTTLTPMDTSARISRTYNYNVNNANSAAQEEELVLKEMRQEVSRTVIRRLKIISASQAPAI